MIAVVGDVHAGNRRPFSRVLDNGLNSRFVDTLQALKSVADMCRKCAVSHVILLGDIFESPGETVPKDVLIWIKNALTRLAESASNELIILSGNHDLHRGKSILTMFEDIPNITVVTAPVWYPVSQYDCLFIPYNRDPEKIKEQLKELTEDRGYTPDQLLFGHFECKGVVVGKAGYKTPIGINIVKLPDIFHHRFFGHIHKPMELDGVVFVGSILQNKTDEEGDEKRIILLHNDGTYRSVGLRGPRFQTVEITDPALFEDNGRDYYILKLKKPGMEDHLPRGHRFKLVHDYTTERKQRLQAKPTDTLDTLLTRYLEGLDTKLDKSDLMETTLGIWKETK